MKYMHTLACIQVLVIINSMKTYRRRTGPRTRRGEGAAIGSARAGSSFDKKAQRSGYSFQTGSEQTGSSQKCRDSA